MKRHRYYIGTMTRDGRPVPASSLESCADLLISVYGGYSLFTARGAWRDATTRYWPETCPGRPCSDGCDHVLSGEIKREPSRVYECIVDESAVDVTTIARRLAHLADQTTVLWTAEEVQGGFS